MRFHGRIALCFAFLAGWVYAFGQDPVHRRYTVADGLLSNTIYSALQDRDGLMWFGTDAGAVRFDGKQFTHYGVEDGLTDNNVIKLAQDSQGRIWFLTLNGKLCYLLHDTIHNGVTDVELGRYACSYGWSSFVEDRQGMLWFGGIYDHVLRLDLTGSADSLWTFPSKKPMLVRSDDGDALAIISGDVHELVEDAWLMTDKAADDQFQAEVVRGFDGRSPALAIRTNGLYALRNNRWTAFLPGRFESHRHTRSWVDGAGDLWVGLSDGGIELRRAENTDFAGMRHLFPGETVNFVYVDDEGGRWFCTSRRGLVYSSAEEFRSEVYSGTKSNGAEAMLVLHQGPDEAIFIGSAESSLYRFDGASLRRLPIEDMGRVLDIQEDGDGHIWLSTDLRTLRVRPQDNQVQDILVHPSYLHRSVKGTSGSKAVEMLHDGSLWVAMFGFWEARRDGSRFWCHRVPDSIDFRGRSLVPHVDHAGRLWYEDNERLQCIEQGRKRGFPELAGRTGLRISDIRSAPSGELLLGTTGAGLLVLDSLASLRWSLTVADGLESNDIVRVRVYEDTLLIATNRGLQVVVGPLDQPSEPRSIRQVKGLGASEVNDALLVGARLLVATSAGLCAVPFPLDAAKASPPRVLVAGAWVNDQVVDAGRTIEIEGAGHLLRIAYRAIAFNGADKIEYQYRMGPDAAWSAASGAILELASLAPGRYALAMRARRAGSDWSEAATVPLFVIAPWWARAQVRVLGFLLLCVMLILATRYLLRRRYRRTLAELRQMEMVNMERSRIAADIHDDLGADLSRLLLYARRSESGAERPVTEGLHRAIDKMDEIIWALDPKRDYLQSTIHFIEELAREAAEEHGLSFRSDVSVLGSPVPLTAGNRRELMLLAREAIRNVVDHAQATTLRIDWRTLEGMVQLMILDDGIGIDPVKGTHGRHGLLNMRKRAERLGGTLRIERMEPHGTCVSLRFPLPGITRSDDAHEAGEGEISA